MIGIAYKKFASAKGFKFAKGIAYGNLNGFIVTLCEGSGYKEMLFSAVVDKEAGARISSLASEECKNKYRLLEFEVSGRYIYIRFGDSVGTLKRIESFVNEIVPLFKEYGAKGSDTCPNCLERLDSGAVTKLIGGHALKLHSSCAEEMIGRLRENEQAVSETKSNAGLGIIGALIFGIIGAIPWAIVYALGWFVGWLGALIGFMVVKGYELFKGKIKKSIIPVFAVIIIVCVIFAQFLGDAFQLGYYILNGDLEGSIGDIPSTILETLKEVPEYQTIFIKNIIIGLVFAALGVYGIFRNIISKVSSYSEKVVDLEDV